MLTVKKEKKFIDYLIYGASILGPVMTVPQAWSIWSNESAKDVSLATWLTYMILSLIWLFYGVFHKEKPIILLNILLAVVNAVVVTGIVIYG